MIYASIKRYYGGSTTIYIDYVTTRRVRALIVLCNSVLFYISFSNSHFGFFGRKGDKVFKVALEIFLER